MLCSHSLKGTSTQPPLLQQVDFELFEVITKSQILLEKGENNIQEQQN